MANSPFFNTSLSWSVELGLFSPVRCLRLLTFLIFHSTTLRKAPSQRWSKGKTVFKILLEQRKQGKGKPLTAGFGEVWLVGSVSMKKVQTHGKQTHTQCVGYLLACKLGEAEVTGFMSFRNGLKPPREPKWWGNTPLCSSHDYFFYFSPWWPLTRHASHQLQQRAEPLGTILGLAGGGWTCTLALDSGPRTQ